MFTFNDRFYFYVFKPVAQGYNAVVPEFSRFLINSSVGLAGFIDVASQEPELRSYNEDMGQTLGAYGIGHGFYIVWPFLGPSSLRDTFGMIGDGFLNPVNYLVPFPEVIAAHAYKYTNDGSLKIGEYEDFKKSAIEPYVALRDAYVQRRKKEVEQ
jgi:phospholipid-binding lipoprotein MlaA